MKKTINDKAIEAFIGVKIQFGARVRYLRKCKKLTIEELAIECDLNARYLGEVERGIRNISLEGINKIANGLNVSLEELFKGISL